MRAAPLAVIGCSLVLTSGALVALGALPPAYGAIWLVMGTFCVVKAIAMTWGQS